jgi:hypothetical protein
MIDTLITSKLLKEYSLIPINFDVTEIWNQIHIAELKYIKPILGSKLYEELLEQVKENLVTDVNATLLLKIYPYLGAGIPEVCLDYIAYSLTEAGIVKRNGEVEQSINLSELNSYRQTLESQLPLLRYELEEFLFRNHTYYPLLDMRYFNPNTDKKRIYTFRKINPDIDCGQIWQ